MITGRTWSWFAEGKHPSVKDFISMGQVSALSTGFSNWMIKGCAELYEQQQLQGPGHISWRFFARGARKDELACGLLRDSSDSIGRPYPFLIMGTGPAAGWEENWELLPSACNETWRLMEQLSSRPFNDVSSLEHELVSLKAPATDWAAFRAGTNHVICGDPRDRRQDPPSAAFIGGTPEASRYVVFRRPLKSSDFINLWTNMAVQEESQ